MKVKKSKYAGQEIKFGNDITLKFNSEGIAEFPGNEEEFENFKQQYKGFPGLEFEEKVEEINKKTDEGTDEVTDEETDEETDEVTDEVKEGEATDEVKEGEEANLGKENVLNTTEDIPNIPDKELKVSLMKKTMSELTALVEIEKYPEEEWKGKLKSELIDYIISKG